MNEEMLEPVESTVADGPRPVSSETYHIGGILTTVFGLDELTPMTKKVACLWLLHPRLKTQECMHHYAHAAIVSWSRRVREGQKRKSDQPDLWGQQAVGLIAVAFDLRNHGSREVDKLANRDWVGGNRHHAEDMFSQIHGNAVDVSLLLDYLPAYLFPDRQRAIVQNLVFGVSLGGHTAWQVLLSEPRITAGIVGIGCPDYLRLMSDRVRRSGISQRSNKEMVGYTFPHTLCAAVQKYDPAGRLFGVNYQREDPNLNYSSNSLDEQLRKSLDETLRAKKILTLSGADDKLVPYECSKGFLRVLERAIGTYYQHGGMVLRDLVFEGVGHAISPEMEQEMIRFVIESLEEHVQRESRAGSASPSSKI